MKTIEEAILAVKSFDFKNATQKEIEEIIPTFGMNDEYIEEMPQSLSSYFGWGIKIWQYPNQFSKFLCYLKDKEIDSYFEMGVRYGGTFILVNELLLKKNPALESHCLDMIPPSEILSIYQHEFRKNRFFYHQSCSQDISIFNTLGDSNPYFVNKQIDFVFIDACHTYQCVKRDYFIALMLGAKYIAFHDIASVVTKGVKNFWSEIKNTHKNCTEFIDQYDEVEGSYMGIGVVEITKEDDIFPMFKPHYHHLFNW